MHTLTGDESPRQLVASMLRRMRWHDTHGEVSRSLRRKSRGPEQSAREASTVRFGSTCCEPLIISWDSRNQSTYVFLLQTPLTASNPFARQHIKSFFEINKASKEVPKFVPRPHFFVKTLNGGVLLKHSVVGGDIELNKFTQCIWNIPSQWCISRITLLA